MWAKKVPLFSYFPDSEIGGRNLCSLGTSSTLGWVLSKTLGPTTMNHHVRVWFGAVGEWPIPEIPEDSGGQDSPSETAHGRVPQSGRSHSETRFAEFSGL